MDDELKKENDITEETVKTKTKKRKPSHLKAVFFYFADAARIVLISLAIILPVRYFLIQPFYVKGASMEPNYIDHEYLIIDEISYRFEEPKRGEVVVFHYPLDRSQYFIKRVIGLPGEEVIIKEGNVYIKKAGDKKAELLTEPYLTATVTVTNGSNDFKLKNNEYFVMGDNRIFSLDSRSFGPITKDLITGRVLLRGWPPEKFGITVSPQYDF